MTAFRYSSAAAGVLRLGFPVALDVLFQKGDFGKTAAQAAQQGSVNGIGGGG